MRITSKVVSKKRKWEKVKSNLLTQDGKGSDVGWWSGYHNNGRSEGIPLAQIAQWIEEGHQNGGIFAGTSTPPRPFMTAALEVALRQDKELRQKIENLASQVFRKRITWQRFYKELGEDLVKLVKKVMQEFNDPANSKITIALKGEDNPTIETMELLNSIDWRISEKRI